MSAVLLQNVRQIYSFDNQDRVYEYTDLYMKDGIIKEIGKNLSKEDAQVIDCSGLICLPGFVNTHHHLYQTLFRGIREVQEMPLFPWLKGLYQFWQHLDAEGVRYGALVGFAELVRTGCTCTTDHHYVFPRNKESNLIDVQIAAAREIGIRFHPTRGSMSLGVDDGGLPPMSVVQSEETILIDSQRLIEAYHDSNPYSMTRIALAPCSPFSVTTSLMKDTAILARKHKVMLHTHLAETLDEEAFCLEKYGKRPFELMESLDWTGNDVWYAHGIYFSDEELERMNGTGIAHCPSSNMKLNSGICRTSELYRKKISFGLAVDGSASNDGSNMMEEVRRMYLLNHLKYGTDGLNAYECLRVATRGGAEVLGRTDTGYLQEGMAADLILFDLSDIAYAGCHDPLVSIVSLGNHSFTRYTFINGQKVSENGIVHTIHTGQTAVLAQEYAEKIVSLQRKNSF